MAVAAATVAAGGLAVAGSSTPATWAQSAPPAAEGTTTTSTPPTTTSTTAPPTTAPPTSAPRTVTTPKSTSTTAASPTANAPSSATLSAASGAPDLPDGVDPATADAANTLVDAVQSTGVLQAALQRLDGEIITANRQVAASTVREQLAARHVDELGRQRDAAADQVRALALARYVDGGQSGIERVADVLRGRDTSEFSREAALEQVTVDSAQQHYTSASRAYRSAVRERDTTRRQLQGATTERDQIVEERTRTETALQSSQGQIDSLRQQVNLGALVQSNGGSIGSLLAAREAGQLPPPIGPWFAWPLAVMHPGSPFGFRTDPVHGWTAFHAGVDFPQPTGTPIRAPANGTVVIAGPESGYGNCTVIDHGNALATLYGHQSAIIVRPGDEVKRGEVIGYVGSTGKSTGPHLHFEVRVLGKPVNPLPWLDPAISG